MLIPELYELFIHNPIVTTDSRNCPRGSMFFALKGDRFDGNQFAAKALAEGSNYAIIDDPAYYQGERTILVDNVLETLQLLAQRHRKVVGVPVIAITGTNGKTTTKELIAAVLSTKFNLLYTEGNLNNQIGVPLTLLRLNHEHEMAVIEMGASHPGDIKELVEIAQPEYGLITNVGRAHLEGFGSFENVL
ncbi:Mur ligase domain-containing protein, partial [Parabacteroides sp. OttesenSCG-928-G06]|nr:Mur ligase domain-containing protein [Parabacteroides sp. OttesenSCG-928-G06]